MDPAKVAQLVEVLNGLTARDGLCLLVGCILTVLDEAPSDVERQQSLDNCIDLLKGVAVHVRGEAVFNCRRVRLSFVWFAVPAFLRPNERSGKMGTNGSPGAFLTTLPGEAEV